MPSFDGTPRVWFMGGRDSMTVIQRLLCFKEPYQLVKSLLYNIQAWTSRVPFITMVMRRQDGRPTWSRGALAQLRRQLQFMSVSHTDILKG